MMLFKRNQLLFNFLDLDDITDKTDGFRPDINWNHLMDVIRKIYKLAQEDEEVFNSNEIQCLQDCIITADINYVYSNVVEFINFYNECQSKQEQDNREMEI